MFLFGGGNKRVVYAALIDIGSGSIGTAIIRAELGKHNPIFLYAHREEMRVLPSDKDNFHDMRRVREALFSTALLLSQDGRKALLVEDQHAKISHLYVTCSSPWAYTASKNVYYEADEPFRIDQELIHDLQKSAESEFFEPKTLSDKNLNAASEVIERATVDFTANDYAVPNPYRLHAKSLGFTHIAGLIPKELHDAIDEIHGKLFSQSTLKIHTRLLTLYCVARALYPHLNTMIIIDIAGDSTELGIVEDGVLTENTCIPMGKNSLIRHIMQETGQPASDIETILTAEHVTDESLAKFTKSINAYEEIIESTITKLHSTHAIPREVIITVDSAYEHFFAKLVSPILKKVTLVSPKVLNIKKELGATSSAYDMYLAVLGTFFHKMHSQEEEGTH